MKMNKKLLALSATFALAAQFGTTAMAANADGDASVTVIEPLTITSIADLDFGTIAGGSADGTIGMSSTGVLTVLTGGATGTQAFDASGTLGAFTIAGATDDIAVVTVPGLVTLVGAGNDMDVTLDSNAGAPITLTGGSFDLEVFGVLEVGTNQAAGGYLGTYNVTVFYQ